MAVLSSAQDCQGPELMLAGQAVALEALGALEALALLLSSTLGLISLALALVLSSAQVPDWVESQVRGHSGQVPDWVESQVRGRSWTV